MLQKILIKPPVKRGKEDLKKVAEMVHNFKFFKELNLPID